MSWCNPRLLHGLSRHRLHLLPGWRRYGSVIDPCDATTCRHQRAHGPPTTWPDVTWPRLPRRRLSNCVTRHPSRQSSVNIAVWNRICLPHVQIFEGVPITRLYHCRHLSTDTEVSCRVSDENIIAKTANALWQLSHLSHGRYINSGCTVVHI